MINKNDIRIGHSGFAIRIRQLGSEIADPMVIVDLVDQTGSIRDRVSIAAKTGEDQVPYLEVIAAKQQESVTPAEDQEPTPNPDPEPEPEPIPVEEPEPEPEG